MQSDMVVLDIEKYRRLKRRDRVVFKTEDLSEAEIQAIAQGNMDARHDYLNAELNQDIGNPLSR